jgi:NDP-sugar pyrophosphorylase family protein
MECVVLAGGLGTRMRAVTKTVPKALIPVAGRPFVDVQLEWLVAQGVDRALFCIGYQGELLRHHVGDGGRFGLHVDYVDEGRSLQGTGGALRLALDCGALPDSFLVLYGDSYLRVRLQSVWETFVRSGVPALMTVLKNDGRWDQSNVRFVDGRVTLYDKSPSRPRNLEYVDYGVSALTRGLVEEEIPSATVFDLGTLYGRLSSAGKLAGFEVHERFYEIGSPQGLADLEAYVRAQGAQRDDGV